MSLTFSDIAAERDIDRMGYECDHCEHHFPSCDVRRFEGELLCDKCRWKAEAAAEAEAEADDDNFFADDYYDTDGHGIPEGQMFDENGMLGD